MMTSEADEEELQRLATFILKERADTLITRVQFLADVSRALHAAFDIGRQAEKPRPSPAADNHEQHHTTEF